MAYHRSWRPDDAKFTPRTGNPDADGFTGRSAVQQMK